MYADPCFGDLRFASRTEITHDADDPRLPAIGFHRYCTGHQVRSVGRAGKPASLGSGRMVSDIPAFRISKFVGACCGLIVLAACAPTVEDVIANNRGAVQAVFDKIAALDAVVASTRPVTEDRMEIGTQRVVLDGEVTNALFIHADDVKSPQQAGADGIGGTYAGTIETCAQAMSGQPRGVAG